MEETNMKKLKKEKVSKEECVICSETINKSTRKKITCNMCARSCCSTCFKRYIMDCGVSPICMWCKKNLSLDFIYSNSTSKFYAEYMDARTDIFLETAKSQLHLFQDQANLILLERNYVKFQNSITDKLYKTTIKILDFGNSFKVFWDKLGITAKSKFSGREVSYYMLPINILSTVENNLCKLCHYSYGMYTCRNCNMHKCGRCAMMCFALNNRCCLECDTLEISKEKIETEFTTNYYTKFIKPEKKRVDFSDITLSLKKLLAEKTVVDIEYKTIANEFFKYNEDIHNLMRSINHPEVSIIKASTNFVKKCPKNDCRGFLTSAWKCGICNDYFCADCHKQKAERYDESHVCDVDEKATVAMLKKNTKPCPKCGMPIDRYTGCTQVWTPCCKIGFYWDTMKLVVNERIHSPEYYDYLRRTNNGEIPRERGDVPCGGRINYRQVRGMTVDNYFRLMEHVAFRCQELHRTIGDINNSDLSIKYLTSDITEEQWKKKLKMRIKKNEKDNHIYNILNMFVLVINDLLQNLTVDMNEEHFKNATKTLINYVNEQLTNVYKRYGSKAENDILTV